MKITRRYLNIPIGREAEAHLVQITAGGVEKREFTVQLVSASIDYWIFVDVSEFKGQTITLSCAATRAALDRIYQADTIEGAASLYKESNRPWFHFTVKRGWNNDVNGPIYYHGQSHLFWQAYPFGVTWDTDFMYWGHAVSSDLIHWRELSPALMVDRLGSPWSGSSFVDRNNAGGWGKDALVLVYTAYDRHTHKQVQCIAYSTDNGKTFKHFAGNPILDTNDEMGTTDTRDPKVFWYEPGQHWVMVLFERDGMSFFTSTDLKKWTRQSHFNHLHECPDFFELPVDGDIHNQKWVLHGGSSSYVIGSFDGNAFTPETPELHYAEGKNASGDDLLYAAQSFTDMPDGRRIQMAWGRITEPDMPFNQMILFPTELKLVTTRNGIRLQATPISEIKLLHQRSHVWSSISAADASRRLATIGPVPLDVKIKVSLKKDQELHLRYQGTELSRINYDDLENGQSQVEVLIDKGVAEIFIPDEPRYEIKEIPVSTNSTGMEIGLEQGPGIIDRLEVYEMKSMWHR